MKNHMVNAVSIALAALFAWCFFSMMLDNVPALTVAEPPQVLSAQPVPRNGSLRIRYAVTVDRACVGEGQRVFTDAGGIQLPAVPFSINSGFRFGGQAVAVGDSFEDTIDVTVPNGAAPGPATYQNQTVFFCNFWQRLTRRGIPFDYPVVNFDIGGTVLPTVAPSTSIFRSNRHSDIITWLRRHVLWASMEAE